MCKRIAYVLLHTTAFPRTAERTVYMIWNLGWFFFSLLKGVFLCESSSSSFVLNQLNCFLYYSNLLSSTFYCPNCTVCWFVFMSWDSNFLNKNKPTVCCMLYLLWSKGEGGSKCFTNYIYYHTQMCLSRMVYRTHHQFISSINHIIF